MQCLAKQICPKVSIEFSTVRDGVGEVYYVNVANKRRGVGGGRERGGAAVALRCL